jgi:hypothetical protein
MASNAKPTPPPQKKNNSLLQSIGVIVVIAIIYAGISAFNNNSAAVNGVHVTNITYHYYNPNTGARWTYAVPSPYNQGIGTTVNATTPFTNTLNCSMTISQAYATTPGFTFSMHNLPITFEPNRPGTLTITIIAPSQPYSGQLNVNATVTYGYGC